jgi:hypothetical protein
MPLAFEGENSKLTEKQDDDEDPFEHLRDTRYTYHRNVSSSPK